MSHENEWDRLVNNKWPENVPIPSDQEAIRGAKMLYKRALGKPFKGNVRITTGNRYTWIRRGEMVVNASQGWNGFRGIIHLLSHYCHRRKFPHHRPHHYTELEMEADLTRYAIERGFHEGKLLPKPRKKKPQEHPIVAKRKKLEDQIKRWESKQKRAKTALKKLKPRLAYYQKQEREIPFTLD